MEALDVADSLGIDRGKAGEYLKLCDEVVEGNEFVAARRGNVVHLAIRVRGLGGRRVLSRCREILARWFESEPFLRAPVRHENPAAKAIAERLGFRQYAETATHVWMAKERWHE
jgi:predicted GNAT family acetyltransferase